MDGLDELDFQVNFNDLPENEEELNKRLSPEEKKSLQRSLKDGTGFPSKEDEPTKLIEEIYGKHDSPSLCFTKSELLDATFHSKWFVTILNITQKKAIGQFLETVEPENKKYFSREELIVIAKNLLLVIEE